MAPGGLSPTLSSPVLSTMTSFSSTSPSCLPLPTDVIFIGFATENEELRMTRWSSPFDIRLRTAGCLQGTSSDKRQGGYVQHAPPAAGFAEGSVQQTLLQNPVRELQPAEPSVQQTSSPRLQGVQQPASWIATTIALANFHEYTADHDERHENTHRHDAQLDDHAQHPPAEDDDYVSTAERQAHEASDLYTEWLGRRADRAAFLRPLSGKNSIVQLRIRIVSRAHVDK